MTDVMKMLVTTPANRNPSAATNTTLYTAPAQGAMVARILVANRSATPTSFRIYLVESGGTTGNQHVIAMDIAIAGNDTVNFPVGAGLANGDFIVVYATLATLTFTPVGIEFA
jgi:hypothetical protein